ncbi:hypothetical protein EC968_003993 [Mortierella alpina]|nr:hypothetical protein EC968_003993 [Mortierella alpina]
MIPKILDLSNGPGGPRSDLKNGQPFICYIERQNANREYYAVGLEGKDFGYVSTYGEEAVVFAFYKDSTPVGGPLGDWPNTRLCRAVKTSQGYDYVSTGQRKGTDYYWANDFEWRFQGITDFATSSSDKGYRLRMNIANKGDAWISDDENTGSIRMRDNSDDRAILYFVTFSDDVVNPGNYYPIFKKSDLDK